MKFVIFDREVGIRQTMIIQFMVFQTAPYLFLDYPIWYKLILVVMYIAYMVSFGFQVRLNGGIIWSFYYGTKIKLKSKTLVIPNMAAWCHANNIKAAMTGYGFSGPVSLFKNFDTSFKPIHLNQVLLFDTNHAQAYMAVLVDSFVFARHSDAIKFKLRYGDFI